MTAPTASTTTVVTFSATKDAALASPAGGSEPAVDEYTAAELAWGSPMEVKNEVGTTYAFVLSDQGKLITFTNGSAITATIPANASVAFPIGTVIEIYQGGAGQVTVAITSDTLRATPGAKTRAQYSHAYLRKVAATTWVLSGDTAA